MTARRWNDPDDFNGIRAEVVRLRIAGHTQDYIATATGLSINRVQKILAEEFELEFGDRQRMIQQAAAQLDYLTRQALGRYESSKFTDNAAGKLVLQALADKRKMFGLDAPAKVEHSHSFEQLSLDEINAQLALYAPETVKQLPPASPVVEAEFSVKDRVSQ